jgi:hypothetical protein
MKRGSPFIPAVIKNGWNFKSRKMTTMIDIIDSPLFKNYLTCGRLTGCVIFVTNMATIFWKEKPDVNDKPKDLKSTGRIDAIFDLVGQITLNGIASAAKGVVYSLFWPVVWINQGCRCGLAIYYQYYKWILPHFYLMSSSRRSPFYKYTIFNIDL